MIMWDSYDTLAARKKAPTALFDRGAYTPSLLCIITRFWGDIPIVATLVMLCSIFFIICFNFRIFNKLNHVPDQVRLGNYLKKNWKKL